MDIVSHSGEKPRITPKDIWPLGCCENFFNSKSAENPTDRAVEMKEPLFFYFYQPLEGPPRPLQAYCLKFQ